MKKAVQQEHWEPGECGEVVARRNEALLRLRDETEVRIKEQVLGSSCTTVAIGGPISAVIEPNSIPETAAAVKILSSLGEPYYILGAGSNLLIEDQGVSGFVIRLGRGLRTFTVHPAVGSTVEVEVGAAMSLMTLSRELSAQGVGGLEFAGGIPASLGGALYMNAGAHGSEMADIVESLTIVSEDGEVSEVPASQLSFSYRNSSIAPSSIIVAARLSMKRGAIERSMEMRADYLAERKRRQPLTLPSVGSVFKNPSPQMSAGALIEQAGLKGEVQGGAQVSELHANWIVNPSRRASQRDFMTLIARCQECVAEETGTHLETEVVCWSLHPFQNR